MIFITIGTQEPFDRLIKAMDEIAGLFPEIEFIAQVSDTAYESKNLKTFEFLGPNEFNKLLDDADLIVSHAGMGTIISALTGEKPIIVVPRLIEYGEHRNEHQLATSRKMEELGYVRVANDVETLKKEVTILLQSEELKPLRNIQPHASKELLNSLRNHLTRK